MQKPETPEERTVGRNGGTHASAISRMLVSKGYEKYHEHDTDRGGYFCTNWGTDAKGGLMVKVEFRRPGRGLRGKSSEDTINRVRRDKLNAMSKDLRAMGYYVSWGWDVTTGDPDTTFIVVSVNLARDTPMESAASKPGPPEQMLSAGSTELDALAKLLISMPQVEQAVLDITLAHNGGKPEVARRLEHALYHQVLLAIVVGSTEDPRMLAAAALATQHLAFPR